MKTTGNPRASLTLYKLIQLLGGCLAGAGLAAMMAGWTSSGLPVATVSMVLGAGIYITGLLGAWWNTGD
ncbi:MAG: hypothetical protein ACREX0_07635 [Noviherbaspirillum sp.]